MDEERELLRHTVATLAYRAGRVGSGVTICMTARHTPPRRVKTRK